MNGRQNLRASRRRANAISEYGDFWVADSIETVDVQNKNNNFKYLYFKSKEHPSKHGKKIGFVTYSFGVREIRDSVVKNIAVKGFGVHGVSKAWNSKFQNLDIDLIGGKRAAIVPHLGQTRQRRRILD